MFDGKYFEWNAKRTKAIVDFYGYKFFYFKKLLDLGCGYGDLGGVVYRLGADVTALDARKEHLKIVNKKFTGIKTVQANLDVQWPFQNQKFDVVFDLGLLCHLSNYEAHLRTVCANATHLVLETAVCDSDDPNKCTMVDENKAIYDLSYSGQGCRPSPAAIERVLTECGMTFKRMDNNKFNCEGYVYDWYAKNDNSTDLSKRRIWFAVKTNSPIKFANPKSEIAQNPDLIAINKSPIVQQSATPSMAPITTIKRALPQYIDGPKKFVIVIPSYKNEKWCEKNINSTLTQNYQNYRVIFTDDCSPDETFDKVSKIVEDSPNGNRVSLIRNTERIGALANLYNMIVSCDDDEIILTLDGDDWLADNEVLNKLNSVYSDGNVWMTYGQYKNSTDGGRGVAQPYPAHIIAANNFRRHVWGASHLRTFYSWLFKKIKKSDLMQGEKFYTMTWDFAIMFPMLEMSGEHSKFLNDILYVYNLENPINDHKVNVRLQQDLDRQIRAKERYNRVQNPPQKATRTGLLLIATNKYQRFLQDIISSADKHFLNNTDVTYYIFSDQEPQVHTSRKVVYIPIEHKSFPFASMDRFKHFTNNAGTLSKEDYIYYVDVDCLFVDNIGSEILNDLVGVRHCGYYRTMGPYETNPKSSLFVDSSYPRKWKHYYGGGFSGGKSSNYLALSKWCCEKIEQDVANGIIPVWHDETAINRYFLDNEPIVSLSPAYHYPQGNIERYKRMWAPEDWQPKILLLDKDHEEIRK